MEEISIPPNANWFVPLTCQCTPDNGLIYAGVTKLIYVAPNGKHKDSKVIDLKKRLCYFSINPNWSQSKTIAIIDSDLEVLIIDFDSGEPIKGHKGHEKENKIFIHTKSPITAVSYLRQNIVLSSVLSNVICYDVNADSYKIYMNLSSRNAITLFSQSPRDENLIAIGTNDGLILLMNLSKMEITSRLRGHDTQICSLEWFNVPKKSVYANTPLKSLMEDTANDCFDIYEDKHEEEFGVGDKKFSEGGETIEHEETAANSNFDFLEACKSLKDDILQENNDDKQKADDTRMDNKPFESEAGSCPSKQEIMQMKNIEKGQSDDGESVESNASTGSPSTLTESDEIPESKGFVFVTKEDVKTSEEISIIASGSREQAVWLWNINERIPMGKITWHPKKHPLLPDPYTNVMVIDEKTLLVTDGNGDFFEYEISFDFESNKITSKENRERKFDVHGVLNSCKSADGQVIWTSSIHRRIVCIDYKRNEKVISFDTMQMKTHFLAENPFDSNLIAVAGSDKRICLWNTSNLCDTEISLRPFMNKIKTSVLCLSWHPEKENLLAFSTKEGRIGILDVNKSTNVPVLLPSFSSKEIYSIAWAKKNDEIVLLTCDKMKFVFYNYKTQWDKNYVDELKGVASIAVNGDQVALGTDNGEILLCDIGDRFKVLQRKTISKKYVGAMCWNGEVLAAGAENGFYIIKNLTAAENISDDNLIHFETKSRANSVRFNKSGSLVVTASNDGFVKVWDIEKRETISSLALDTPAFTAIFLPSNEDFVVCGGQETTVIIFDTKKHNDTKSKVPSNSSIKNKKNKRDKEKRYRGVKWATPTEITTISQNAKKRQKNKIEIDEKEVNVEELAEEVQKITLSSNKKCSTLFAAANRELTVNPIEFMENILRSENTESRTLSFNEQIFGDRAQIKKLLESEIENKKSTSIVLPQLNDTLKDDISNRIANKTLTDAHVAISPSISYDLWKKTCAAYAFQCVEKDDPVSAISYFLAVNDVNNVVYALCETKFYREAWIIAKMRKLDGDPIFDQILRKWLDHLDSCGNFESAAALMVCQGEFEKAATFLEKRTIKTEKGEELLQMLKYKQQHN